MAKIFNFQSVNFINLNSIVVLTLACATKGRITTCDSRFADCGMDLDHALESAMNTVKAELTAKGLISAKDVKAIDAAVFHMVCAVYNCLAEQTDAQKYEYFMREIKRTLKFEQVAEFVIKSTTDMVEARHDASFELDIAKAISHGISLATSNRVEALDLVTDLLEEAHVPSKMRGLRATDAHHITDAASEKIIDMLVSFGLIDAREALHVSKCMHAAVFCAITAFSRNLKQAATFIDVLNFKASFDAQLKEWFAPKSFEVEYF